MTASKATSSEWYRLDQVISMGGIEKAQYDALPIVRPNVSVERLPTLHPIAPIVEDSSLFAPWQAAAITVRILGTSWVDSTRLKLVFEGEVVDGPPHLKRPYFVALIHTRASGGRMKFLDQRANLPLSEIDILAGGGFDSNGTSYIRFISDFLYQLALSF